MVMPLIRPALTPTAYPLRSSTSECHVLSNSWRRSSMSVWRIVSGRGKYISGNSASLDGGGIRGAFVASALATFEQATGAELQPRYLGDTLAFMFETRLVLKPSRAALTAPQLQRDYWKCWQGLKKNFSAT